MKRVLCLLALSLAAVGTCAAEDLTLPNNVILRSDRSLLSLKAGTVVEVVARDDKTLTIRVNGQTGTIPVSSLAAVAPTPAAPAMVAREAPISKRAAPSITIGPRRLALAYAPADSPVGLREYLPAGESLDHWNRLASVRVFGGLNDPAAYLKNVAAGVAKSNPAARYQFLQNNETKDLILDFMVFATDPSKPTFAEWNLMRAVYEEGRGLVVYQYAVRYYTFGSQTGPMVNEERNAMAGPFETASFIEQ